MSLSTLFRRAGSAEEHADGLFRFRSERLRPKNQREFYVNTTPHLPWRSPFWHVASYTDVVRAMRSTERMVDYTAQFLQRMRYSMPAVGQNRVHPLEVDELVGHIDRRLQLMTRSPQEAADCAISFMHAFTGELDREIPGWRAGGATPNLGSTAEEYVAYVESHWVAPQATKTVMPMPTMGRFTRRLSL